MEREHILYISSNVMTFCMVPTISPLSESGTLMTKTSSPLMREISLSEILGMPSTARRK